MMKFRTYVHLTLISKIFMLSQLSDFAVCSTGLNICEVEIHFVNSSDRKNTSFHF